MESIEIRGFVLINAEEAKEIVDFKNEENDWRTLFLQIYPTAEAAEKARESMTYGKAKNLVVRVIKSVISSETL